MPRSVVALLLGLALSSPLHAAPADVRYAVPLEAKTYPQATAKETLASVIKAVESKRFDYVVAQLADPKYIDDRVQRLFGGKFEEQVAETRITLDASTMKLFQRFLKDGQWERDKAIESVRLKDVKDRYILFRRVGDRWYLENRNKPSE